MNPHTDLRYSLINQRSVITLGQEEAACSWPGGFRILALPSSLLRAFIWVPIDGVPRLDAAESFRARLEQRSRLIGDIGEQCLGIRYEMLSKASPAVMELEKKCNSVV